jgi:hypothetical protein
MLPAIFNEAPVGPDFICVGAQKGGTRWLFDQLDLHPDFWMPALKELHYFNRDMPLDKARKALRNIRAGIAEEERRPMDKSDAEWLRAYIWLAEQDYDLDLYARLFAPKGSRLSGDITPTYAIVDRDVAMGVRARFPNAKILYIARDPVSRCWSQYCMASRRKEIRFESFFARGTPEKFSSVTSAVDTWRLSGDDPNFRLYFFDELASNPDGLRRDILSFIGGDPDFTIESLAPDFNRKQNLPKIAMPPTVRAFLVETFADEIRACSERFGGPADDWLVKYDLA